ncbi:hypothetical protein Y032_0003g1375 [Ancylostoma ceylanicum]|uniref:Uncharacterized protein n=1 Tax=Ancylostoma ceylanicum TaxID=53326 RepID=A0A016VYI7_9BILA|nr:hypothetical protein Y032_0003g1375 [Ancylostoma ceylanicum]
MENNEIQNFLIGALLTKGVLDTPKEDYIKCVRDIFHFCFNNDKCEDEALYNRLEQSDREEFVELRNVLQAKERELGLEEN